ncbi:hypothetical protein HQ584_10350 [Patescibacteria group bacterium]|nr:hypothetical protein [Patescibacteria group bacterium]
MYKKIIIYILFLFSAIIFYSNHLIFAQTVSFQEALAREGLTEEDYNEITLYYYKNPQPDKLISVLKMNLTEEEFLADKIHFSLFAYFISTVAHDNRDFLEKLKEIKPDLPQPQKNALAGIISEAENFKSATPSSPFDLDYLWVEFIATGKEKPIRKIISVLDYPTPEKSKTGLTDIDVNTALLISSAQWSLGSNAEQHEKVNEILKDEFVYASGIRRERLEKILQTVNK